MMEHYVTLFDSLFLPQGLALHLSLERHAELYTLWILCIDDEAYDILRRLNLANVRLLRISDVEVDELKKVKLSRTPAEYCWTLTPFAPRFVFEADATAARVTYVDADLWFRKNPAPIFREYTISGKEVLISDHAYAPEYDSSATSGQYCVQFITFSRLGGELVRKWWEEQCVEWCSARFEDGKFGDQMYLNDWTERFAAQVHILSDKELILGPWNATRFPYGRSICWHFHGLRIMECGSKGKFGVDCGYYPLPPVAITYIYREYLKDLQLALAAIRSAGGRVRAQKQQRTLGTRVKAVLVGCRNQMWRQSIHTYLPL
jgi:hypothetical protein